MEEQQPIESADYFVVSVSKLGRLFVLTFGFYGIYWFYKNWTLQKKHETKAISPVWRSIFSIFFVISLFQRIANSLTLKSINHQFNANSMAIAFIVINILSNVLSLVLDRAAEPPAYAGVVMLATVILMAYPLQEAQEAVNLIEEDPLGASNAAYRWPHIMAMIVGGFIWFSVVAAPVLTALVGQPAS